MIQLPIFLTLTSHHPFSQRTNWSHGHSCDRDRLHESQFSITPNLFCKNLLLFKFLYIFYDRYSSIVESKCMGKDFYWNIILH